MKKRINTIDGKILVQGGTDNELKSNEIRVNADKSLTERVNGEIVNVGSGSGGGLRPITAEDVQLKVYSSDMGGEMTLEFATEFNVDTYNGKLRIYSDKPLFIGQGTDKPFLYNATESRWECQSYPSYSGMNVVLDIYTQD